MLRKHNDLHCCSNGISIRTCEGKWETMRINVLHSLQDSLWFSVIMTSYFVGAWYMKEQSSIKCLGFSHGLLGVLSEAVVSWLRLLTGSIAYYRPMVTAILFLCPSLGTFSLHFTLISIHSSSLSNQLWILHQTRSLTAVIAYLYVGCESESGKGVRGNPWV